MTSLDKASNHELQNEFGDSSLEIDGHWKLRPHHLVEVVKETLT